MHIFHIIFVGSNHLINKVEVVLRKSMILSLLLCFNYMYELLSSLIIHSEHQLHINLIFVCLFVLRFYDPVNS